jgi:excisionase family DNA binding protein
MELKSKREAAELLGLSTRGVERAVRRGHLAVLYRDSKYGKQAWFSPGQLDRYKQLQKERAPVGFTSPGAPLVGTLVPMVEVSRRGDKDREATATAVPIADRLTLTLEESSQLSGLPRSFIVRNIHSGKLKAIRIGRSFRVKRADLNQFVQGL